MALESAVELIKTLPAESMRTLSVEPPAANIISAPASKQAKPISLPLAP